jgi:hypothetical protein
MSSQSETKFAIAERQARRFYGHFRELWISYEGSSEEIPLRPPDLSTQGMFIQTGRHFPEGAVLKIRFQLARTQVELSTRAEVRYCLRGVGVGIEFLDVTKEFRNAIEKELRAFDAPASPKP